MLTDKHLNKLEQKNLKNVCRLCLIDGHSLREIYGTKISSMIQYCLDIKIEPQHEVPTHVCVRCFRQIINFYTFKRKIQRNDQILKKVVRHKSKIKDIINMALEKSDISPLELNEIHKVEVKVSPVGKKLIKKIKNPNEKTEDKESQNKIINIFHKPVVCNEIQDVSIKPNSIINTEMDTSQRPQNPLCINYNIEPPPLVPLQPSTDIKGNTKNLLENSKLNCSISPNISRTNMLLPPPLVPINPVKIDLEIDGKSIKTNITKSSCNLCKKEFESLSFLKEHKLKSNCEFNTHKCNICEKSFMDPKKLMIHLKGHKVAKEYLCNVCGKRYSSPSTFRIHFRSHTGERPFKCNICGKGFVRWAGVKNHMVTHEDFKPYKCETCGKQFKVISNLYRHQRLHTGNYTFCCSFCGKTFCQSDHLKLHIRTYHTNEKPYLCCECGKGFVSSQRLKRHELVHSGQKPYPCSVCLRAYSNAIDLKNHTLRVHNKNGNRDELKKYACSVCSLKFRHPCRLTKHMKIHADLNKNCPACDHSFKCVQALTRHLKTSSCKNIAMSAQAKSN